MSNKSTPLNIELIHFDPKTMSRLGEVKTGQILDNTGGFHPEGLFSAAIFGPVGSPQRNTTFGVIQLNCRILHPFVYNAVIKLKAFYKSIMDGTATAEFDTKLKDFVPSKGDKAQTGFSFFCEHLDKIAFTTTGSEGREFNIKLVNKALKEDKAFISSFLVLPAGLRDYTIDPSGKPEEEEVNGFYRKILAQASLIDPIRYKANPQLYDASSIGVQRAVVELDAFLDTLLEGKNKLILDKWLGRKTFAATRNVISGYVDKSTTASDPKKLGYNEVIVGIHQFATASIPKSIYELRNKYVVNIFPPNSNVSYLTNAKTLKKEEVPNNLIQKDYDLYTSPDGLEKVISSLGNYDVRLLPVTVGKGKYYLGLLYRDDKCFKFFQDIDDLPEGFSKDKVSPITLFDFIYCSIYHLDSKLHALVTRYPITGFGSIVPFRVRLQPTNKTVTITELDEMWELRKGDDLNNVAVNFPISNTKTVDSMVIHPSRNGGFGSDYDGDALSLTMLLTDSANNAVETMFDRLSYYVDKNGSLYSSQETDTLKGLFANMT